MPDAGGARGLAPTVRGVTAAGPHPMLAATPGWVIRTRGIGLALSPHHAARAQSGRRARLLLQQARPQGGPPPGGREEPLHARLSRRPRGWTPRRGEQALERPRCAARRADPQLGWRGLRRSALLRPPRLRGRRHLRHLREADEGGRDHQPTAARRQHGVRALARQALDRTAAEGQSAAAEGAVEIDAEHRQVVRRDALPWLAECRLLARLGNPLYTSAYLRAFS